MILDDLSAYLQTNGVGTEATDLFVGHLPQQGPNSLVAVLETGGMPAEKTMGTAANRPEFVEAPRFQVICRGNDYEAARTKAHAIYKLLDGLSNFTWSGTQYFMVEISTPIYIGQDENMRHLLVLNGMAKKRVHA